MSAPFYRFACGAVADPYNSLVSQVSTDERLLTAIGLYRATKVHAGRARAAIACDARVEVFFRRRIAVFS